jgi:hypothetical protein
MREHFDREQEEIELLRKQEKTDERIEEDLDKIVGFLKPRPTFIKIKFGGNMPGPVTLIVGQKTTASVAVFDQNGVDITASYNFTANPITWSEDVTTFDTQSATGPDSTNTDVITSIAAGTTNLTALTGGLTDVEQVINQAAAPVPTSIKINFSAPQ